MTVRPLDFDFAPMSNLSRIAPRLITGDAQERELREDLARRRDVYPMLVRQGRGMNQEQADRHIRIWEEILADVAVSNIADHRRWGEQEDERAAQRRSFGISWEDKVRELRRDLAMRRNAYPGQIQRGRLPEIVARDRMEAIEAVHWRYWIEGFVWDDQLQGHPPEIYRPMWRDFHTLRMEWELAGAISGQRWARPMDQEEREWTLNACQSWRQRPECGLPRLDNAA